MDPTIESFVTDELRNDPVAWPILEKMPEKSVTDVLKGYAHSQHRLGSAVPMLNGDAKPEEIAKWRETHLPKLISAKLIDGPKQLPEKYEVKLPDTLPKEVWTEESQKKAEAYARKHGLSQEALQEGVGFLLESLGGYGQAVQVNRQASVEKLTKWAGENNVTVEEINATLDRFNKDPLGWDEQTAELVSKSGFADHPLVIQAIYKLMKDSGTLDTRNDGGSVGTPAAAVDEQIKQYLPGGAKWDKIAAGDRATLAERDAVYSKKFPGRIDLS